QVRERSKVEVIRRPEGRVVVERNLTPGVHRDEVARSRRRTHPAGVNRAVRDGIAGAAELCPDADIQNPPIVLEMAVVTGKTLRAAKFDRDPAALDGRLVHGDGI